MWPNDADYREGQGEDKVSASYCICNHKKPACMNGSLYNLTSKKENDRKYGSIN